MYGRPKTLFSLRLLVRAAWPHRLLPALALAGLLAACGSLPPSGEMFDDFDDLGTHHAGNAIVVTRTTSTEFQDQPYFMSVWTNLELERRGVEERAFYFPTRSTRRAPGAFGAYSVPPGEYRNAWNEDKIDGVLFWIGDEEAKVFPHFRVGPDEVVYVGDINFNVDRAADTFRITFEDRFAEAKAFLEAKHPALAGRLVKRLAYYRPK